MPEWKVTADESGIKLLQFIKAKLGDALSTKQIKKLIEEKKCSVNKRPERFSTSLVGTGDVVHFDLEFNASQVLFDQNRILFEDDFLLIYDKPSYVSSDDVNFLKKIKAYNTSLILIHRLDKETSGALLFAKGKDIQEKLITLFKEKTVKKEYLALVDGEVGQKSGVIDNLLDEKFRVQGQVTWGSVKEKGLRAITKWKMIKSSHNASLLLCFPITGRTHQIRVHLSELGHPILGDGQYGKTFKCKYVTHRNLLHAFRISFTHPINDKELSIESPIPEDFSEAIKTLFK